MFLIKKKIKKSNWEEKEKMIDLVLKTLEDTESNKNFHFTIKD